MPTIVSSIFLVLALLQTFTLLAHGQTAGLFGVTQQGNVRSLCSHKMR